MSDHLPDCFLSEPWNATTNPQICVCDRLRACEQRVMSQFVDGIDLVSYRRGLDAAREAASNTRGWFTDEYPDSDKTVKPVALIEDVVNRIDALREEQK